MVADSKLYDQLRLENDAQDRSVKGAICMALGDIALAIEGEFQRYLQPPSKVMLALYQASKSTVDVDDEYLKSVLDAFTGVSL